jgi:hypothetical protein
VLYRFDRVLYSSIPHQPRQSAHAILGLSDDYSCVVKEKLQIMITRGKCSCWILRRLQLLVYLLSDSSQLSHH